MPEDQTLDLLVPAALEGERVDRALALITGLSRREVDELLGAGRVDIGRRPLTSRSRRVHAGERLLVHGSIEPVGPQAPEADPTVTVPVVYEDPTVIVVDKPAGLVVHPGHGNRHATLVHGLLARFPDLASMAEGDQIDRPGIVHRLDKGTSGLLVVARTEAGRADLAAQLQARTVGREYLTLVFGHVESDEGLIDAPVGRSDIDPNRMRVQSSGRPARTRYELVARYADPVPVSLLRCRLETGRTHQIRVHLASIGHAVVGDDRYGGRARGGWPQLPSGRPFLHAGGLGFDHPESRQPMYFRSPLPADLSALLDDLSPMRPPPTDR